jgi:hypothetical protein
MTTKIKTTAMKTKLSLLTSLILMTGATVAQAAEYSPLVFGSTYVSAGASSNFGGDIVANTYLVVGASTTVTGSIQTGTAITIGAASLVGKRLVGGGHIDNGEYNIESGTATTVGANSIVDGNAAYGTAFTLGAGGTTDSTTPGATSSLKYNSGKVNDAQDYFNNLTAAEEDDRNQLTTLISEDLTLNPNNDGDFQFNGTNAVYNANSLTTSEGITLTLEGNDIDWVFNITDMMTLGADTKIVLAENTTGSSVTWNLGGYASLGAGAQMIGTILASGYVTTGVDSKVTAANKSSDTDTQSYCGGLFSATSYVTLGASATVTCAD